MKDRQIGVNCPPMHPFCRSVTVPEVSKKELKKVEKDSKIRERIRNSNLKIHEGKQGKHIRGHNNYKGGSYLLDNINPQELVDKYVGKGNLRRDNKNAWTKKEFFEIDKTIGVCVNDEGNKSTRSFSIHYSKTGVHVVPRSDKNGKY